MKFTIVVFIGVSFITILLAITLCSPREIPLSSLCLSIEVLFYIELVSVWEKLVNDLTMASFLLCGDRQEAAVTSLSEQ